jgi:catechol 2,3-dioxygenase-like lactoylglutathione lyase family enzyme
MFAAILWVAMATMTLHGQQAVQRPRITGISHVAYFVSDLPRAVAFWHDFLGYDEPYTLPKLDSPETRIAFIKINDRQQIELLNEPPAMPHDMMSHLCFAVDDIAQIRRFLEAHGYTKPEFDGKTPTGDLVFEIKDPDGVLIEFMQSTPDSWEKKAAGKFLPETRIAPRIYHVGYMVSDSEKTIAFYKMLGFTETWRGGGNPKELSWINMKVPDGDDYVELMLYHAFPPPDQWGGRNHVSLMVPDIEKAVATLQSRPYLATYGKPLAIHTGVNGKRQMNLFDPDGTRVELMEPRTVSGVPAPSSTAPPPPPSSPWVK